MGRWEGLPGPLVGHTLPQPHLSTACGTAQPGPLRAVTTAGPSPGPSHPWAPL